MTEPWITLGRDFDHSFILLNRWKSMWHMWARLFAGLVAVNMQGAFCRLYQALVATAWRNGHRRAIHAICRGTDFPRKPECFSARLRLQPRFRHQFYQRIGYERIGELKDYVITGQSEILMRNSSAPGRPGLACEAKPEWPDFLPLIATSRDSTRVSLNFDEE